MIDASSQRAAYLGMRQIFEYNRPFYLSTMAAVIATSILAPRLPLLPGTLLLLAAGVAVFWICSSLLVSHYIYDRSGLYRLDWLKGCLSRPPRRWINIHAGIDEISGGISSMFPDSEAQKVDIYDPLEMTESSINRARRFSRVASSSASWHDLPAADREFDTAFLIFTGHELRRHEARVRLLSRIAQVLQTGGELVLVEHLRDWRNFLAFGPGFFHFLSARAWRDAVHAAGLSIRMRRTVTPFIHVFVLQRQS
ncbi:MAG TPA: class I SAM-dependent methyltransferase [Bryobacteraceae bacterium]|nr:class I SAM-dependent methyltransferase [Bryobacteraceae bacterium]